MDIHFYLNKHYLVILLGVFCGIMSLLTGGFGIVQLDKLTHLVVFITVVFVNFYLLEADLKKYRVRCIILSIMFLIYSVLINLYLVIVGTIIQVVFFIIPNPKMVPQPDLHSDSPLRYGLKYIPVWRIILCFVYALFLFVFKERLFQS